MITWTASEALPVKAKTQPRCDIPIAFQNKAPFSSDERDNFIYLRVCYRVVSAGDMGIKRCNGQREHQRGGLADLTRITERLVQNSASAASG